MATILGMRDAIAAGIAGKLTALQSCESHHGELDEEELRRTFTVAPAACVVFLGFDGSQHEGRLNKLNARWGVFVLTAGVVPKGRDDAAITLVNALSQLVPFERWGLDDAGKSTKLRGENLYTLALGEFNVALWLVSWYQPVRLDPEVDASALDALVTVHLDWDLAPPDGQIDAEDTVQLEQP